MNQLHFLGTGGSRVVVFKQLRASGGVWLSYEDTNLLLDPGPGSLIRILNSKKLQQSKLTPEKLDGILLSHRHLDHCADINILIEAMTEGGFKKRGKVFVPSDAIAQDPVIYEFIREKPEEIVILQPNHQYSLKSISFKTTNLLAHPVETYGFNFGFGAEKISFITDTKLYSGLASEFFGEVVVINVGRLKHSKDYEVDQLSIGEAVDVLKEIKPRLAILTHFGMTMLQAKPWEVAKKLTEEVGFEIVAASDGYSHEIADPNSKQLNMFG